MLKTINIGFLNIRVHVTYVTGTTSTNNNVVLFFGGGFRFENSIQ